MKPVRLGLIGCGVIGSFHAQVASQCPFVRLVAVADLIPDRARAIADKYNVPECYPGDEELLRNAGDVEAVVLAMPVVDRTPVAFKALRKGLHVLLEKPVAANVRDVKKMIALRGDRVVAVGSGRITFTSHGEAAARCVASGALGQIRSVRVRAIGGTPATPPAVPVPWRQSMRQNGGGILVNWGCYDLDYLMYVTGWKLKPRTVMAQWWPVARQMKRYVDPKSDADSHFTALIRCDNNIALTMERAEFSSATGDFAWEIVGSNGTLHLPMVPMVSKAPTAVLDRFVPGQGVVSESLPEVGMEDQGKEFLADFVRCIRRRKAPRTSLERALLMQRITDAIYASASSGKSVAIRE